jgi:phosphoglucomutase
LTVGQGSTDVVNIVTISCAAFADQRPGTAGLRKRVAVVQQPHYLECFVQALLDTVAPARGAALVLGGDGRYYNDEAIQIILRVAAANGVERFIVGQHGWLSTPAASHLIRLRGADGGFILTASHNPGGPDGDFGIKFNVRGGGQAAEALTEAIYHRSRELTGYRIARLPALPLERVGAMQWEGLQIEIVDPVADYARLMEQTFDFERVYRLIRSGRFSIRFDALHAITGPYARAILEQRLGAAPGSVVNATPLVDFGGGHPDPNPVDAADLVMHMSRDDAPDFAAASDGDGDRNMVLGRRFVVSPGDSLAVLAANAHLVPGYAAGLAGVARSMPTSRAVDRVAARLRLPSYETPTGWRYFFNLLEAGRITLCGEESFGTGSSHVREKDGLWAVLFWLNLVARRDSPVEDIVRAHWKQYGRDYFSRHDYYIEDPAAAQALMTRLRAQLGELNGHTVSALTVENADDFSYTDPIDGSVTKNQGIRVLLTDGSRIVFRLSGTGTGGATLRIYLERYVADPDRHGLDCQDVVAPLAATARRLAAIESATGLAAPTAVI